MVGLWQTSSGHLDGAKHGDKVGSEQQTNQGINWSRRCADAALQKFNSQRAAAKRGDMGQLWSVHGFNHRPPCLILQPLLLLTLERP